MLQNVVERTETLLLMLALLLELMFCKQLIK